MPTSSSGPVAPAEAASAGDGPALPAGIVVAVDGPSGSGKSSVSRAAARALGVAFLDTGAMYRAVTLSALRAGVDLADAAAVAAHVRAVALSVGTDPQAPTIAVVGADGTESDVSEQVRGADVTAAVSAVAAVPAVRSDLVLRQRALIESACAAPAPGARPGVVAEGRDITTVVAPEAHVRVLLTADERVRLARRAQQDLGAADAAAVEAVRRSVSERDRVDARTTAFTTAADGVVTLDSTHLDFDGTVAALLELVRSTAGEGA
ncbi:(d)CMP kinase [Paenibacillus sp. TRM 82003]|uniref:(d)CMP kinase n=1 Tax=Kineococcus sp. TRM81007 TaxID=2925831 RepID=UPI001F58A3CD|nr:(d)CMP kinase [Kineococcus sp. TRM81007]MCI2240709.1 (d)CMP kinase [Kineococcus sp. TRM81007]MCI3925368.1 (d)CMP kinase [Paenibacillus sp. TRM 82003]